MIDITAIVLTRNEEERVGRCLRSLKAFRKVLVFDSLSTDGTFRECRRVWKELGRAPADMLFLSRAWPGFVEARNQSREAVTTAWVLWLDADEWLSPELEESLKNFLGTHPTADFFRLGRQSFFLGRRIRHGGWYPDRKARLAQVQRVEWRPGPQGSAVHEDLRSLVDPRFKAPLYAGGEIYHEPFRNRQEQQETNALYSSLLAEGLARKWQAKKRKAPSLAYVALKVLIKFVENYFWKLGFLDGRPGLLIALGSAQSLFWRYQKARAVLELEPKKK